MTTAQPSSRHDRYERTWNTLHNTAFELVKQKGLKQTTVDEIVEKAGVSPRTFFNYFQTKDDAVLGLRSPRLSAEMLERDAQREDRYIYVRVAMLMLEVLESGTSHHTAEALNLLLGEHPELKARVKNLQLETERVMSDFLLTVDWEAFRTVGRRGPLIFLEEGQEPSELIRQRARASVFIAYAVLRHISVDGSIPPEEVREQRIIEAVEMVQDLLRED